MTAMCDPVSAELLRSDLWWFAQLDVEPESIELDDETWGEVSFLVAAGLGALMLLL